MATKQHEQQQLSPPPPPPPQHDSIVSTMVASSLSGMAMRIPLHPIDTCKAKMQVQQPRLMTPVYRGLVDCFMRTLRTEGVRGLYQGFPIAFFGSAPASCLYLTSYELSKRAISTVPVLRDYEFLGHLSAGLAAECFSCILWVPIDVVKERFQVQTNLLHAHERLQQQQAQHGQQHHVTSSSLPNSSATTIVSASSSTTPSTTTSTTATLNQPTVYRGTWSAIRTIFQQEGVYGIYRGYGATLASFGPYSALYLAGYEQFKQLSQRWLAVEDARELPFYCYLASGGLAGGIAAVLTNPLDMAKLRIQVQRSGNAAGVTFGYRNIVHGMSEIVRTEGALALYKGAGARVAFYMPSSAFAIALFDSLKAMFARHEVFQ